MKNHSTIICSSWIPLRTVNYSLWKVAKAPRKPPSYSPPLRRPDNTWALSDKQQADTFPDHLQATFQPNDIVSDHIPIIVYLNRPSIKTFLPEEIRWKIDKFNNRKASGLDLVVTARISNEIPKKTLDTNIHFNLRLQ